MDWKTVLEWLFAGPGAGILAYAALEEWGGSLAPKAKRYIAILGIAVVVSLGYAASVWWGYNPAPVDVKAWIEAVAPLIVIATGVSQLIHGARDLN